MNADLDTLATALYVTIDDDLANHPEWAPERPTVGIAPKLSDAELLTLAVLQALLGSRLKPGSSGTQRHTSQPCSPTSRSGPATTNDSEPPPT